MHSKLLALDTWKRKADDLLVDDIYHTPSNNTVLHAPAALAAPGATLYTPSLRIRSPRTVTGPHRRLSGVT